MSDSFVTPWTVAHQTPLASPGDLPHPGIKPGEKVPLETTLVTSSHDQSLVYHVKIQDEKVWNFSNHEC